MNKLVLLIVGLILISFVFAAIGSIANFVSQDDPFNVTFIGEDNHTYFMDFPRYGYLSNISLILSGYNNPRLNTTGRNLSYEDVGYVGSVWLEPYFRNWAANSTPLSFPGTDSHIGNITFNITVGTPDEIHWRYSFAQANGGPTTTVNASILDENDEWVLLNHSIATAGVCNIVDLIIHTNNTKDNKVTLNLIMDVNTVGGSAAGLNCDGFTVPGGHRAIINNTFSIYTSFTDLFIEIGNPDDIREWNYTASFTTSENVSLNQSIVNNILENDCNCNNCSIIDLSCRIPFLFHSNSSGVLQVKTNNISYEYGIDNCSNSLGIPSNATALNVSFSDAVTLNPSTVNVTTSITGIANYSANFYSLSNYSICVYPNWFNQSESIQIQYNLGDAYNQYNFDTYLNNVTQQLNLYTQDTTSTTTFTVKDQDTDKLLDGVLASMYRQIDGEWQPIEAKTTDITGRVQFSYQPYVEYRFYFARSGYEDYIFYLNPVLYSSYDVKMTKSTILNETVDYDRIALTYSPTVFYNGLNNFTFLIQSPYSELLAYGYTLTYPGGSTGESGNNPIGSQLTSTDFNIVGATNYDTLRLDYYYNTELSGLRNFTFYYTIIVPESNYTMMANRDRTYGLGLFERLLIAVSIIVLVVGIATLIGQPIPGMALGLIILGYLTYIGLVPLWATIISITIGLLLIGMRGGE